MEKGAVEWKKVQLNKKTCPTHTAGGQAIHSLETDSDYRPQQSTIMAVITIAQQASNAQSRKTIAIRDRFQLMVRPADWAAWQVPPNTQYPIPNTQYPIPNTQYHLGEMPTHNL